MMYKKCPAFRKSFSKGRTQNLCAMCYKCKLSDEMNMITNVLYMYMYIPVSFKTIIA